MYRFLKSDLTGCETLYVMEIKLWQFSDTKKTVRMYIKKIGAVRAVPVIILQLYKDAYYKGEKKVSVPIQGWESRKGLARRMIKIHHRNSNVEVDEDKAIIILTSSLLMLG